MLRRRLAAIGNGRSERSGPPQIVQGYPFSTRGNGDSEDVGIERHVDLDLREGQPEIERRRGPAADVEAGHPNRARKTILMIAELLAPTVAPCGSAHLR